MATQGATNKEAVFEELFIELSAKRGGSLATEATGDLLRHERGARTLVGLDADAERAIFHDARARTLRAMPIGQTGLSRSTGETLHRDLGAVETWVQRHRHDLEWIHPRFRPIGPAVRGSQLASE